MLWAGRGSLPGDDGWVSLRLADRARSAARRPTPSRARRPLHQAVLDALGDGQALFFRQLSDQVGADRRHGAGRDAVGPGLGRSLTNDTLAPLRALLGGSGAHRAAARRRRRTGPPPAGRPRDAEPHRAARRSPAAGPCCPSATRPDPPRAALADRLLDRHGVVTRGAVVTERVPGGFAGRLPGARARSRSAARPGAATSSRGSGAAQFAVPGAVDRLRALAEPPSSPSAPARGAGAGRDRPGQPVRRGAAVARAGRDNGDGEPARSAGHRPGRKAGALVVLVDGELALYVERGGRTLLSYTDDPEALAAAGQALADAVRAGRARARCRWSGPTASRCTRRRCGTR